MVMLGLTFFSASMWTGSELGAKLTFDDFFLAVLLGNLILGIYTSFLGYIGASTGLSTHLLARFSFGLKGSWLPSILLGELKLVGLVLELQCLQFQYKKQRELILIF